MKKPAVTLIVFLVASLALWLFLGHREATEAEPLAVAKSLKAAPKTNPDASSAANARQAKADEVEDTALEAAHAAERLRDRQERDAREEREYNTPISFYGLVLDQFDRSVPEALVTYASVGGSFSGERKLFTDSQGKFTISSIRGKRLRIIVGHPGYYDFDQSHSYYVYAGNDRGPDFKPDSAKPEIFRLRKKGEAAELIRQEDRVRFENDEPARSFSFYDHSRRREQPDYVILQRVQTTELDKQGKPIRRLEMVVPEGGIQQRTDPFAFTAPSDGYQPSMYFMRPEFGGKFDYFVKFNNGNFARFTIMGSAGDYLIDSYFNPDKSPNLEYDPAKEITVVRNRTGIELVYPAKDVPPKKP